MPDAESTLHDLREHVRHFVRERDWEQFHNPKDLAAAIAIEAAELMEVFLWMSPGEVDEALQQTETRQRVREELADVLILCLSLANRLEIDVADAVIGKLQTNAEKYPAVIVRGNAKKYTQYQ